MIAWQPRRGYGTTWHLTHLDEVVSICGVAVAGVHRFVKRDPHKIDHYGGDRCRTCWAEWGMETAASYARQDQHEAARATPRLDQTGETDGR